MGKWKSGRNRDSIRADTGTESWIKILCKEKNAVCVCKCLYFMIRRGFTLRRGLRLDIIGTLNIEKKTHNDLTVMSPEFLILEDTASKKWDNAWRLRGERK